VEWDVSSSLNRTPFSLGNTVYIKFVLTFQYDNTYTLLCRVFVLIISFNVYDIM
jgi:hypothetical protein